MTPNKLMHAWFENVWNQKNDDFVRQHMGCPCNLRGLPESASNPEGFIEFRNHMQASINDMYIEVLESMGDKDKAIATCRITGTHSVTGLPVDFCFAGTAKFENEKIVEAHNIIDFLTMLQQAKAVPEDSLEKAFAT